MNQPRKIEDASDGLAWLTRPYRLLRERRDALGDTFTLQLGRYGEYVVFSDPDDIKAIFAADVTELHAGQGNAVLRAFLGAGSLLLLEETAHQRERKLLAPGFHARRLDALVPDIERITHARMARIESGSVFRAQDVMQDITLEVIVTMVFGERADEFSERLKVRLNAFLNDTKFNLALIGELGENVAASATWASFRAELAAIRTMLAEEIDRRRRLEPATDDMLSLLMTSRYADGGAISDEDLVSEVLTLVVTGYETTATALAWALYHTHRDPRVLEALRAKAAEMDPRSAHTHAWLASLCREVLRIHPVIPIVARRAARDVVIGGRRYAAGAVLAPCIYLTHHRPSLYPSPDTFVPERFLERSYASNEYLPFGGGARRCIGMGLALMEMAVVLCLLARTAELELVEGDALVAQRRSVTVAPSRGTPMRLVRRRTSWRA